MTNRNRIQCRVPQSLKDKEDPEKERNIFVEIVADYCNTSTLHGISYLGAKDKSIFEKIWWIIMLCLSVGTCMYLISNTWIKWKTTPVILSFEREQVPIWEIPFPAVTICSANKIVKPIYDYEDYFKSNVSQLDSHDQTKFWDISLVCNLDDEMYVDVFSRCSDQFSFTNESVITHILDVASPLNETIFHSLWQNNKIEVEDIFTEQLTEEGLCFTFNSFSQEDMYTKELNHDIVYINHIIKNDGWSLEDGYSNDVPMETYPKRSANDGQKSGISIFLKAKADDEEKVCGASTTGYKVILHNPSEPPRPGHQFFVAPADTKMTFMVRPELTRTEKSVRSLSVDGRKCFFSNEKSLRFFKVYTKNNCRIECQANVTNYYCGCVPFYVPRDNKTLICGFAKIKCIKEAEMATLHLERKEDLSRLPEAYRKQLHIIGDVFSMCNCLPTCNTLDYTAETSVSDFFPLDYKVMLGIRELSEEDKIHFAMSATHTRVDIFFKESQFLALQRTEFYGQTDFFANCGGLLGLFMGFSLLSGLEIIYFFTIRLWLKYRNRRKLYV